MAMFAIITICFITATTFDLPTSKAAWSCPKNWQVYHGNCYLANMTDRATWHEATEKCKKWNATLADIQSRSESTFVKDLFYGYAWIGLHDLFEKGTFRWIGDGTVPKFTNWKPGEPDNAEENYVVATYTYKYKGLWNDKSGGSKQRFICEKPLQLSKCPSGWKPFRGKCYAFNTTESTWKQARDICKANAGDLVKVKDKYITNFIKVNIFRKAYWIGLHKIKTSDGRSKWVWLDETTETLYTNWELGQPDNAKADRHLCGCMKSTYYKKKWNTDSCTVNNYYACKKPTSTGAAKCQFGWQQFRTSCYFLNKAQYLPWDKSRKSCQGMGGDLVTISDAAEQEFFNRRLFGTYIPGCVWIGLSKADDGWIWVDKKPAKNYTNWSYGEPGNRKFREESCVIMHATSYNKGSWDNVDCTSNAVYGYICEIPSATCPAAWIAFDGHCYRYNMDPSTWQDARRRCRTINKAADLVVIESNAEQMWIESNLQVTSWIGLNSNKTFGKFVWLDTTAKPSYTKWGHGQPNLRPVESCVRLGGSRIATWSDSNCNKKSTYVCKKPAGGDPVFYDFKYKSSMYQIGTVKLSRGNAESRCKEVFGLKAGLAVVETLDEQNVLKNELNARMGTTYNFMGGYWIGDTFEDNTTTSTFEFWDENFPEPSPERTCLAAFRKRGRRRNPHWRPGPPFTRYYMTTYELKLRNEPCCSDFRFICEKSIKFVGNDTHFYDFAFDGSAYRIVRQNPKEPEDANKTCQTLLPRGYLAQMDSAAEMKVIAKELTVRHLGKVIQYWISGNPKSPKFKVNWATQPLPEHRCMYLVHRDFPRIDFSKESLNVYPSKCVGAKPFLCERRLTPDEEGYKPWSKQTLTTVVVSADIGACGGPCIGLAVFLPIIVVISVVLTLLVPKWNREGKLGTFFFNKSSYQVHFDANRQFENAVSVA